MALDSTGLNSDTSVVTDVVNRMGIDEKRKRNEMIRGGLADIGNFQNQYSDQINQSLQPTQQATNPTTATPQDTNMGGVSYMGDIFSPGKNSSGGSTWHPTSQYNDNPGGTLGFIQSAQGGSNTGDGSGWWETPGGKHLVYNTNSNPEIGIPGYSMYDPSSEGGAFGNIVSGLMTTVAPIALAAFGGSMLGPAAGVEGAAGGAAGGTGLTAGGGSLGLGGATTGLQGAMAGSLGSAAGMGSALGSGITGAGLAGAMSGSTALGSLGGLFGNGGIGGTGIDLGSTLGNNLAESAIKNTLMNGGDAKKGFLSSLMGAGSGFAGGELSKALSPEMGDIVSKMFGGAASGGIRSLFNSNSPIAGALMGASSGGLGALLNSTNLGEGDANAKLASGLVNTIGSMVRRRRNG